MTWLWMTVAWLVVLLLLSIWVGLKAWRLFRKVRSAQAEVERHIAASKLNELGSRLAELQRRRAVLIDAVDRLEVSIDQLGILRSAARRALEPLFTLRSMLRA